MGIKKTRQGNLWRGFKIGLVFAFSFFFILFLSASVGWKEGFVISDIVLEEDTFFEYNFSENIDIVPGVEDVVFSIVSGEESFSKFRGENVDFYLLKWVLLNGSSGIMEFNSTTDDHTGVLLVNFLAKSPSGGGKQASGDFKFIINAVNDPPEFIDFVNETVIRYVDVNPTFLFSAIDEEKHYPLNFSSKVNNCTLASGYSGDECNLSYIWNHTSETSGKLTFFDLNVSHRGKYNITVCVNDTLPTEGLPEHRVGDYDESKSSCMDFELDLRSPLKVTDVNCSNISEMYDNETVYCQIEIESEFEDSKLNLSSNACLVDGLFDMDVLNRSWFFENTSVVSTGYKSFVNIPIAPKIKEGVGNWTIDFFVHDISSELGEYTNPVYLEIPLFVNRSNNSEPVVDVGSSFKFRDNSKEGILFDVSDDDFLILDKGVYNETIDLTVTFSDEDGFNRDFDGAYNLSPEVIWKNDTSSFFYPNPSENDVGNWSVNLTAKDASGAEVSKIFSLEVVNNSAPKWNVGEIRINCTVPSERGEIDCSYSTKEGSDIFNGVDLNLSNVLNGIIYATDDDESDVLIFSNTSGTPRNFNLSSEGILNFSPWKQDVGEWEFSVNVSDGILSTESRWIISVNNTNSPPRIQSLYGNSSEIKKDILFNIPQGDFVEFKLAVEDYDFLIGDGENENLTVNISFVNFSSGEEIYFPLFSFNNFPERATPNVFFKSNFTPGREHVGKYNVSINVTDISGEMDLFNFTLNVERVYSPPEIIFSGNLSSAVGREFKYFINAVDHEDEDLTGETLTYNYSLVKKEYFGRDTSENDTFRDFFDEGMGGFDLKFNESHAGVYVIELNVTSNVSKLSSYEDLWLFVYDEPNISYPGEGFIFSGNEGEEFVFKFSANHSVGNDLIYEVYVNKINCSSSDESSCIPIEDFWEKKNNGTVGNGDGIQKVSVEGNFSYDDECYSSGKKQILLKVFPADENLSESEEVSSEMNWSLNVGHKNHPIEFNESSPISGFSKPHTEVVTIDLSNHFRDIDAEDKIYNQNILFSVSLANKTDSDKRILINGYELNEFEFTAKNYPEDWKINISCMEGVVSLNETLVIGGRDLSVLYGSPEGSATSNPFEIEFYKSPEVVIEVSRSRKIDVPFFMKLIVPNKVSGVSKDSFLIPLELVNSGKRDLTGIELFAFFESEKDFSSLISMEFSEEYLDVLRAGERKELFLRVNKSEEVIGEYSILINASSKNPEYSDWGRVQIVLPDVDLALERVIFAERFILENYECLEIGELTRRARTLYDSGEHEFSLREANRAIDSCRIALLGESYYSLSEKNVPMEDRIFKYFFVSVGVSFFIGASFYLFSRNRLKFG